MYDVSKYDIHSSSFAPLSPLVRKDGAPTNTSETNTTEATNPTVEATMPTTPQTAGDTSSAKIYLWVGVPCVVVLGMIGVVFGVKKKRKKE